MMTEEQKNELAGLCRIEIRRWKHAAEAVPDKRYMVELMELALAALTQPASPALRLPDEFSPHDAKMFCAAHGVTGAYELASQMANYAVDKVVRLNTPHTAPIEPICGAEWVKVSNNTPDPNSKVIAYTAYGEMIFDMHYMWSKYDKEWMTEYSLWRGAVTHWMYHPAAPEEE